MKIKLLSLSSESHEPITAITKPVMQEYAERYGIETSFLPYPDLGDHGLCRLTSIETALSTMDNGDVLLFLGADVLLTNHTIDLRKAFIPRFDGWHLCGCFDACGLQTDVMLVLACVKTSLLFQQAMRVLERDKHLPGHIPSSDQGALIVSLAMGKPFRNEYLPNDLSEHWYVHQLHQTCNAREGQWKQGDWGYHQSGDSFENKKRLIEEKVPLIVR